MTIDDQRSDGVEGRENKKRNRKEIRKKPGNGDREARKRGNEERGNKVKREYHTRTHAHATVFCSLLWGRQ